MAEPAEVSLPATLRQAVRTEFFRAFRPPFESLVTVAVNGALMSSSWFLLPAELKDEVFTLHGTLAFALVLAAWMYSDVPATNLLGPDSRRVTATIDDPVALRRLLSAKSIFLWLVVTPVCLVVALVTGIFTHDPLATLYTVIWIGVVPFGVLSITAWVGILYPYHPMPLRYRWEHRRPRWRMLGRWITLVVAPYGLVPLLAVALMALSLLLWGLTSPHGLTRKLPDNDLGWGVALACAMAAVATVGGRWVSIRLARRRRVRLLAFLADPTRG